MADPQMNEYRKQIDDADDEIVALVAKRLAICKEIGEYKQKKHLPVMDFSRVDARLKHCADTGVTKGLDPEFIRDLYGRIIEEACRLEERIIAEKQHGALSETIPRTVILGGGAVGTLFADTLSKAGSTVTLIDREPKPDHAITCIESDAAALSAEAINAIRQADLVMLALPNEAAAPAFDAVAPLMKQDALLCDTLSVKTPFLHHATKQPHHFEQISINPMFAPSLGFRQQAVVAVPVRVGERSKAFLGLLEREGSRLRSMTAEEHDKATAALQTLTHAALLSFGGALKTLDYDVEKLIDIAPPPHRLMLGLLARLTGSSPHVYHDIQMDHPLSGAAYDAYAGALQRLHGIVQQKDTDGFEKLFADINQLLQPKAPQLTGYIQHLLTSAGADVRLRTRP